MSMALLERFDRHARERAGAPALIVDDRAFTWRELHEASIRSQSKMHHSLPRDAIVAIAGSSGPGAWIELTAALRSDRTVMLVPPRLPDRSLASIASAFRPDMVLSSGAPDAAVECGRLHRAISTLPRVTTRALSGGSACGGSSRLLLFSSGTTGRARAIVRSAAAIDRVALTLIEELELGPRDRILSQLPMHHAYGLEHAILAPILSGATVLQRSAPACGFGGTDSDDGATILPTTPFLLESLLLHAPPSSLRRVYSAGTHLPQSLVDRVRACWSMRVDDLYGASELGTITLSDSRGHRAVRGVSVRIVAPDRADALVDLANGVPGEIAVRSDAMFEGYLDARDGMPRRERSIDGHFRTGDLGVIDAHGPRVVGRIKLQFDVGGLKVNAEEVERVLERAPGVRRAVLLPLELSETLHRLRAVMELVPGASEDPEPILAFARANLAPHEVPRSIEFVDRLPRSPSGKILRGALMDRVDATPGSM